MIFNPSGFGGYLETCCRRAQAVLKRRIHHRYLLLAAREKAAATLMDGLARQEIPMGVTYNVLILGASYGSLLGAKMALAGHNGNLVCLPEEAKLINEEGLCLMVYGLGFVLGLFI